MCQRRAEKIGDSVVSAPFARNAKYILKKHLSVQKDSDIGVRFPRAPR